jgi:hypothetical protein
VNRQLCWSLFAFSFVVVAYGVLVRRLYFLCDDAFISFRYARNWALGHGPRYNLGDQVPVEGYSNFLWMAAGAVLERLGLEQAFWLPLVSMGCGVLLLGLVFATARERLGLDRSIACASALSLACFPPFVIWTTGGLETMPHALILFASFLVLTSQNTSRSRLILAGALGAALVLIRTEGIAWVFVVCSAVLLVGHAKGHRTWKLMLPFAAVAFFVFAIYLSWRWSYYGSNAANTMRAKMEFSPERLVRGAKYVGLYLLTYITPIGILVLGVFLGWRSRWKAETIGAAWMTVAVLGYGIATSGDFMTNFRLLVPFFAFQALLLGVLLQSLSEQHRVHRIWVAGLALVVVGIALAPAWNLHLVPEPVRSQLSFRKKAKAFISELDHWQFMSANVNHWRRKGLALAAWAPPDATLVAEAIGNLGWYSKLFIYDQNGLVTRTVDESSAKGELRSPGHDRFVGVDYFLPQQPTILAAQLVRSSDEAAAKHRKWAASIPDGYRVEVVEMKPGAADPEVVGQFLIVKHRAAANRRAQTPSSRPASPQKAVPPEDGRWRRARATSPASANTTDAENQDLYEQLLALGYATGSRAPSGQGVSIHDESRAFEGFNFYTSAHDEMAVLMDMDGNVLHEWRRSFSDVIEGSPPMGEGMARRWWRRGWLLENGDVIALNTGMGVMRIDKDSNVLWATPLNVHHDLEFREDGGYITLIRNVHIVPRIHPTRPIAEDEIVYLNEKGEVERSFSVLEAFERSSFKQAALGDISTQMQKKGNLFHTNSIALLDGTGADRLPALAAGNLLLSFRELDAIGIVDPKTETMVWFHRGQFVEQHDPRVLASGNILLFDNKGLVEKSRILELDPIAGDIEWQYSGSEEAPFYSGNCGIVDPLPNGNFLITESNNGRAFEVTRHGDIVWEFLSPHRAGDASEFVATLPEVIRLPKDFPMNWLR